MKAHTIRAAIALAAACTVLALPSVAQDRAPAPFLQDEEPEEPEPEPPPAGTEKAPAAGTPATRELDTSSPEAQALKELLHVDPRYAKDGTVELVYEFDAEAELLDWQHQGFDLAETRGGALTLGAGSQGQGLVQHTLAMQGPYEVLVSCRVDWLSTRSDLVLLLGKGGARFGNQFVEKKSSGFKPVTKNEPARDRFGGGRDVQLRYVVDGDDVTVWVNGVQLGTTNKLKGKLAGKVGLWMTDMRLVVQSMTIKGKIDASKL
jgi:hypothetical protein